MGLRFRKSITLCKGVKLNFGKTGASITTGVKGFHKTYNFNTGKTTTSVGVPGTGIYYTETNSGKKTTSSDGNNKEDKFATHILPNASANKNVDIVSVIEKPKFEYKAENSSVITADEIESVYRVCDEKIDWFEFLSSSEPTTPFVPGDIWTFLHKIAARVCSDDIDAFLEVIEVINPYDDLLNYCKFIECGVSEAGVLVLEFSLKDNLIFESDLAKKFLIDACVIRIARDTFALLPASSVVVCYDQSNEHNISYKIEREKMEKVNYRFTQPDIVLSFVSQQ